MQMTLTIPISHHPSSSSPVNEPLRMFSSPDKLLSAIGPRNHFLLFIWVAMALVWGVGALPIMVSAFLMDQNDGKGNRSAPAEKGTVTEEFNLDGAHSFLVDLTTSGYIAGMAVGSILMPFMADKSGRRPALLISLFLSGAVGIASAFSYNIFLFILMRFVQGLSFSGCILVNWVLAYECIPLGLRSRSALLFGLIWVVGYCLVAPMAYFLANWRQLIAATSAPSLLFAIFYFFTIPESFHYLVSKRKVRAIREWVKKANKCAEHSGTRKIGVNELNNFLETLELMKSEDGEQQQQQTGAVGENTTTMTKCTMDWTMVLYLGVSIYIWTCDTFIYYGLSLFSTQLAGDRYLNFILVALVEIPSYLFAPFLLDRMGRRLFTVFMHFLAASAFFFAVFIIGRPQFFLLLWLIGKFAISSSFTGLFVYSSEVFPTVHRNLCMGLCTTVSQASGIFAPAVKLMANLSQIAPLLFFGFASLLACGLTFLLPETKGRELPERRIATRTE